MCGDCMFGGFLSYCRLLIEFLKNWRTIAQFREYTNFPWYPPLINRRVSSIFCSVSCMIEYRRKNHYPCPHCTRRSLSGFRQFHAITNGERERGVAAGFAAGAIFNSWRSAWCIDDSAQGPYSIPPFHFICCVRAGCAWPRPNVARIKPDAMA